MKSEALPAAAGRRFTRIVHVVQGEMEVTSDAISGTMSREHVTLIPSWTRRPA